MGTPGGTSALPHYSTVCHPPYGLRNGSKLHDLVLLYAGRGRTMHACIDVGYALPAGLSLRGSYVSTLLGIILSETGILD